MTADLMCFLSLCLCESTLRPEGLKGEKTRREIDRNAEIDCEARRVRKKFIRDGEEGRRKEKSVCRTHTSLFSSLRFTQKEKKQRTYI